MRNFFVVVGTILDFAPFMILGLVPFWENIINKKKVLICTASVLVYAGVTSFIFGTLDEWERFNWLWFINYFAIIFFCLFIYSYAVKLPKIKSLFILFVISAYAYNLNNIVSFFERRFFPEEDILSYYPPGYTLFLLPLLILTIPFARLFIRRVLKPALIGYDTPAWKYMWLVPCFLYIVNVIYGELYVLEYSGTFQYLTIAVLLLVVAFFVYYFSIKVIVQTDRNARFEKQLEWQNEHYTTLQSHIEETKRAEHDLRHHLATIQSYTAAGEKEKLEEYLSAYIKSLPKNMDLIFCENFAVNSILQYYIGMAKNEDIEVDVSVVVPVATGINDTDLCIIFGNCIENAVEACRIAAADKSDIDRFIKIRSTVKGKMMTIIVANSFNGNIKKEGDRFLSLKHEGEGVGISSVKAVVEKYGGVAQFETDGNEFRVTIILRVE